MKRINLLACASLLAGCIVEPMPAHKMFGTSNPSFEARRNKDGFVIKAGTNVSGTIKTTYDPATGALIGLEAVVDSNAGEVVDAEGRRIPGMEAQRIADELRVIRQAEIQLEREKLLWQTLSPILERLTSTALPTPTPLPIPDVVPLPVPP